MRIRKPNRLKHFDYSLPGYYFITICVDKMKCVFGEINNEKMDLNRYGRIAEKNLKNISKIYKNIELNEVITMPNHLHAIIVVGAKYASTTDRTKMILSKVIQQFKRACTIDIKKKGLVSFKWQRSFYDRIIRNERELYNIRKYIQHNPMKWDYDKKNIENVDL